MTLTREMAWEKLNQLMSNRNLIKHCLAVEAAMLAYADYFEVPEEEKEKWGIVGLLHDADYEKYPERHPEVILGWLKEIETDDDVINAVAAHGFEFNIEPQTLMAKVLRAVDELTGLIVAVALVRPSKEISEVTIKSIRKKWKTPSFTAGVKREDIERGAGEIDVSLDEHISTVLQAMQGISGNLGL